MARLTIELAAESGRSRRRSVVLNLDGEAWLEVESELLGELDLSNGQELDESRRLAAETTLARARARLFVVRSLAAKAQSTAEIERKLAARGVPEALAREAVERAAGYGYLDDRSLAGQLARGMRSRGYGRRRAEQKLRQRGLGGELATEALAEAYDSRSEAGLAREALGTRRVSDKADRRRAVAFLRRRGFSADAAWRAVRDAAGGS